VKKLRAPRPLDDRSKLAIEGVLSGQSRTAALVSAGYSRSYADRRAGWFFNRPEVKSALEEGWAAARKETMYNLEQAMKETSIGMELSIKTCNSMSYIKAVELRSRLQGLLHDVLRVEVVDVRSAIAEANARRTVPWTSYKQIPVVNNNNPFED
jgi:hypothetical protein